MTQVRHPRRRCGQRPTPTELLLGSLASCVAFYARRYRTRHGLDEQDCSLEARAEISARPARVLLDP